MFMMGFELFRSAIKQILLGCACAIALIATPACRDEQGLRGREGSSILDLHMVETRSTSEIEANFVFNEKKEVRAGAARFLFYTSNPYRGIATTTVYCYEQVRTGRWILRGFLPVTTWDYREVTSGIHRKIEFTTNGESVSISCNGVSVFTLNPQPSSRGQTGTIE